MRLIDAEALVKDFSVRAVSARNWKERAIMEKNEEAIIRADATLALLSEVKLTIDNAPTVEQSYQAPKDYIRNKLDYSRPQGEDIPFTSQSCPSCGNSMWGYENGKIVCCVCGHTMADMRKEVENE